MNRALQFFKTDMRPYRCNAGSDINVAEVCAAFQQLFMAILFAVIQAAGKVSRKTGVLLFQAKIMVQLTAKHLYGKSVISPEVTAFYQFLFLSLWPLQ